MVSGKNAPQMAIIQLGAAFKNFWAGRAKYTKFRKKGVHDRFPLTNDQFSLDGRRIRIPHLGWVRMREALCFRGKLISATVSRVADRWFISITVAAYAIPCVLLKTKARPGWIWGYRPWQHSPQGEKVIGPKSHRALLKRLRRLSRNLLRKKKGSANRTKAKAWICKAACQDCQYPAGGLAQAHLTAQATISPRACQRAESGRHGEEPVILPAFYPTWVS